MNQTTQGARPPLLLEHFRGPGMRAIALGLLMLVLLIPQKMIESRVNQRAHLQTQVFDEIARSWGGRQNLSGPLLRIPYVAPIVRQVDGRKIEGESHGWLLVSAAKLDATVQLNSDTLKRGLFEAPVYRATLRIKGIFHRLDQIALPVDHRHLDWAHAELWVGLSDPASLSEASQARVAGKQFDLSVGQGLNGQRGVRVELDERVARSMLSQELSYDVDLAFNGSGAFMLVPMAGATSISMVSDWPHPSFVGAGLPTHREVRQDGFTATWALSRFASPTPVAWKEADRRELGAAGFAQGVHLLSPVDPYRMASRIARYGALVILLSFALIWMTELLGARRLHPIQYLMIGGSLCLFGLLQLALAEHLGFDPAYVIAALAVVLQAGWYAWISMNSLRRAGLLGTFLCAWFAYLYVVLGSEDFAFLLGSIALFAALSATMWATRRLSRVKEQAWEIADATLD